MTDVERVVLIGNYIPDAQESMLRFADSLRRGLTAAGVTVELWAPPVVVGRLLDGPGAKWLRYVDKYLFFPPLLLARRLSSRRRLRRAVFHVTDHSNAPYLRWLPADRTVVTCHDVLAIRGALGHADAFAPASRTGRVLQRWIRNHLVRAPWVASDSQQTLDQLEQLAREAAGGSGCNRSVIRLGFNNHFERMADPSPLLREVGVDPARPYLLHVGASHPRKNRGMLVHAAVDPDHPWGGVLCFAGAEIDRELRTVIDRAGLGHRVVAVVAPSHEHLVALYSGCAAFVFPSLSEGFGWPVIEAQACGAPVVASRYPPMPEIGGAGATYVDPLDPADVARAVHCATASDEVPAMRAAGSANGLRFRNDIFVDAYLDLYRAVLKG